MKPVAKSSKRFFGILYRIDDLDDGSFYIGAIIDESQWNNGYLGSGVKQRQHLKEHPPIEQHPTNKSAHHYKRTVLKDDFLTKEELYEAESKAIMEHCAFIDGKWIVNDPKCNNIRPWKQGDMTPCSECGSKGTHKRYCSRAKEMSVCEECGGKRGQHRKGCSKLKPIKPCPECGVVKGHLVDCSKYKRPNPCPECGATRSHIKGCSRRREPNPCPECGTLRGHVKTCSRFRAEKVCQECGGKDGKHIKACSRYKKQIPCSECGCINGHNNACSKKTKPKPCPECGKRYGHKKICSQYKEPEPCPECNKRYGHRKICSRRNARSKG